MADKAPVSVQADQKLSEEQQRLSKQVEVIARDMALKPGGQPYLLSYDGVDKKTGETIKYKDLAERKDDVLRTEKGRIIAPEEYKMQREGWGKIIHAQPSDRSWTVNANIGIRTHGSDALTIKLVEKQGEYWKQELRSSGLNMPMGEDRRWEYQISRKGLDASKPENVLIIPVFSNFGAGIYTEIGNKGSSYTSQDMTTKNFQSQKVLRKADDIEIIVPPPAGMGVALAVLERDPFDVFAGKKALRGGSIVIPEGSLDLVNNGFRSSLVQLKGDGNNWGEITFTRGLSAEEIAQSEKAGVDTLYAKNPLAQDEIIWKEKGAGEAQASKALSGLNIPAADGQGIVKEGASITVSGNTGTGATLTMDGKGIKVPPHNTFTSEAKGAWYSPPVWLHGPGNKGSIDLSGLDGRIVISGGGKVLTSQVNPQCWWYAEVILTGGTATEKAVYTIEIPQFNDEKKKLDLVKKGPRDYKLERYPMQPYESIPLVYPDGSTVQMGQTENDVISIRGTNIEVRIKEGDQVRTVYDSDKPELNKQSMLHRKSNGDIALGGIALASLAGADQAGIVATRRQFLATAASAAASLVTAAGSTYAGAKERDFKVREPLVNAPDPILSPLNVLMPDIKLVRDGHSVVQARAPIMAPGETKITARG